MKLITSNLKPDRLHDNRTVQTVFYIKKIIFNQFITPVVI